ncbi:MAG: PIG-L family deacetylase [Planctomycetota bacterium]|nr:PIG-L family deacetylase [Planctomycetota bacterium]
MVRVLVLVLGLTFALVAQKWPETCGKSPSGVVALQQSVLDIGTDLQVLLVASHPDDRYVLPAVWLRFLHGARIAVLLATRGGGGQNSAGPETGDALERVRTLETEAGCSHFDGDVWYLNRPDGGFRRTAEETYAEWGQQETLRELVALLRRIRPDVVLTTHHAEEQHGHDLALVELLGEALRLAPDASFVTDRPAHRVTAYFTGAQGASTPNTVTVNGDLLEANRGRTLRRLAYEILRTAHTSPGDPPPIDWVFEPTLRFEPQLHAAPGQDPALPLGRMPSLFDEGIWTGTPARARELESFLSRDLPLRVGRRDAAAPDVAAVLAELRGMAARRAADNRPGGDETAIRLQRRIESLERLLVQLCGVQIELDVPPGTVAIAGEEFTATVQIHASVALATKVRAAGLDGVEVRLESFEGQEVAMSAAGSQRAHATIRMPPGLDREGDPMRARFSGDRFVPPVRIRFVLGCFGSEVPIVVTVPVEERPPVELTVVPRILLLPTSRRAVQFSVDVARNSQFPVDGELEVRAPAGYAIPQDRRRVTLGELRGDLFSFEVGAADERKAGVDVIRVALGGSHVALPVHKIEVRTPLSLRVGVVRSRDDTLAGVLGVGGLGLQWSELSDADIAIADLSAFDTIVVDVRSLRDRPAARRGFRRLLEFAARRDRRLVVFYQKDTEFHVVGEGFLGAPFAPFQVGKARVTRADAPVRALMPDHVLLRHPNVIRPGDWDGWEQERGLYFPSTYASQYEEVLEMRDPGQPLERGALLYARTGEGEYVYCALALWRQLKKLHPGAVRLLANLLTPSGRT